MVLTSALRSSLPVNSEIHSLSRQPGRSWVVISRKWRPSPDEAKFAEMWEYCRPTSRRALKLFGRVCYENRYSLSWGHDYAYSGQTNSALPIEEGSFVAEIAHQCQKWAPVNSCLQNWYEAESSLALHADDEKALVSGLPIISLSWGATRRFRILPRDPKDHSLEINLSDGDLLIMGGDLQITHRHDVPPYRKTKDKFPPGQRISWTFRVFREEEHVASPPLKRKAVKMASTREDDKTHNKRRSPRLQELENN